MESIADFSRLAYKNPNTISRIVIGVIVVVELIFISAGNWVGDYWEHNAVLKELISRPINPGHPIISGTIPHAFYSPYSVALGFTGNLFSASAFTVLTVMAVINLALYLIGLYFFIRSLGEGLQIPLLFPLVVLLHLFAWGPDAWTFSSFFHFNTLHYVLPYPSTFAVACSFFSISIFKKIKRENAIFSVLIITLLNSIVLLTHPTTFLFLTLSLAAITIDDFMNGKNRILIVALFTGIPFLIATWWPYYPFWQLMGGENFGSAFHDDSRVLFNNPALKILPALPALALLFYQRFRQNRILVLNFALFAAVYGISYVLKIYGPGRIISFIVLILHIHFAAWLLDQNVSTRTRSIVLIAVIILAVPYNLYSLKTVITENRALTGKKFYDDFKLLTPLLEDDDVVLVNLNYVRYIPAFGGKVTATVMPPYWIPDNQTRVRDIQKFYDGGNSTEILSKYDVKYILLTGPQKDNFRKFLSAKKIPENHIVMTTDTFILARVL